MLLNNKKQQIIFVQGFFGYQYLQCSLLPFNFYNSYTLLKFKMLTTHFIKNRYYKNLVCFIGLYYNLCFNVFYDISFLVKKK